MRTDNPFDEHIEAAFHPGVLPDISPQIANATGGRSPQDIRDCSVIAVDTLYIAWLGAQSVFESKAKPEHALAIYDRIVSLLNGIDVKPRTEPNQTEPIEKLSGIELMRKHANP